MRSLNTVKKFKAIAILVVIFLVILATNMMDSSHFKIVKNTLNTVYEDRLVAKNYLHKISGQLHLKNITYQTGEREEILFVNKVANDSIQTLINKYAATKLTSKEAQQFELLQLELKRLSQLEQQFQIENSFNKNSKIAESIENQFSNILLNLSGLSEIQLEEGKREINYSNQAISTSDLISKLEIGTLIALALIIQILIWYRSSNSSA